MKSQNAILQNKLQTWMNPVLQPDLSKRKLVSLTSCQIEPHFQDARNVTHVFVVVTMSLALNSLPPLF
jgi:hypothetical protein